MTTPATTSGGAGTIRSSCARAITRSSTPGAGSHAAYFEQGEYLTAAPIPAARGIRGVLDALRSFWRDTLRQDDPGDLARAIAGALSIPFIDYARADGRSIGPDQHVPWSPVLIDDDDALGGRLPGALRPRHVRPVRRRARPGRTEVEPGGDRPADLARPGRMGRPREGRDALARARGARGADRCHGDGARRDPRESTGRRAPACPASSSRSGRWASASRTPRCTSRERRSRPRRGRAGAARRREAALLDEISASRRELERIRAGDFGDPRAHIRRDHHPVPPELTRYGKAVELWSAVSISLVLIVIVASLVTRTLGPIASIILGLGVYVVIDAAFRRRLGVAHPADHDPAGRGGLDHPRLHVRDGPDHRR